MVKSNSLLDNIHLTGIGSFNNVRYKFLYFSLFFLTEIIGEEEEENYIVIVINKSLL